MLEGITKKGEVKELISEALGIYRKEGLSALSGILNETLLSKKVRFPLLEYAGILLYEELSQTESIELCEWISNGRTMGGNVIIGIILQKYLETDLKTAFDKASEFISLGSEWYVTDIIGERVFGVGLLEKFEKAFPEFLRLKEHQDPWVVRAIGPGAHYATKKGLNKEDVGKLFDLLLELRSTTEPNVKTGIGWAAKTVAKFHPAIIEANSEVIFEDPMTGPWFIRKVKIGLERNAYAKGS